MASEPELGPPLAQRELAAELKRRRRRAKKTPADVEEAGIVSRATLYRYESGEHRPDPSKVGDLLRLYGADDPTVEQAKRHARRTRERGWWQRYGEGRAGFVTYLGLESSARRLLTFQGLIPGLFQTQEYAWHVEQESALTVNQDTIRDTVAVRMERRAKALERSLEVVAVLDEAALRRHVGGPEVLSRQIRYLLELTDLPLIKILILPWHAGAHPADVGPFTILEFGGYSPIAFAQAYPGAHYMEEADHVKRMYAIFEAVSGKAVPIKEFMS